MSKKPRKIGVLDEVVVTVLNLSLEPNTPIYISDTNIEHMKDEHPEDFEKYGDKISDILSEPDYIAEHPNNGSIQYIKVFIDEETQERVLVAVRSSKRGILFARSLFVMSDAKIKSYEKRGAFKEYKKEE
ncbi:transposase [Bacillus sp. HNG]|uniref:PBECR3 domain-containing polyvalent protein n=1 Tax=Bacillus sp. HNG TaxID=2293325 RepID=UPI000E2FB327|nr:PBECR2 nuclease fold domain-containing protein [Bacillus sp. HNG]RFB11471.1 transposase [Bacillus sp. HNG]